MVAKIAMISLALIIAVGLSTWALAWAYRKHVETEGRINLARYSRDEAMVEEADRESKE